MHRTLKTDDLKYWFALKSITGVGEVTCNRLLDHFDDPKAVFQADSKLLKQLGLKQSSIQAIRNIQFSQFDPIFEWLEQPNHHVLTRHCALYPPLLTQTNSPPLLLFAIGHLEHLLNPQIAVVGSRSPTPQGLLNTNQFCKALAESGLTITSGLALGVDGQAHRATLKANGYTIAVTGTGLARVYPAVHRELAHSIAENGLLISECFPDEGATAGSFPKRNRIIAGLSLGTLVIEAAKKSGSLITAQIALEESREVFAIPGSIHNLLSHGCHALIRQGAKLVETCEDILEELPSMAGIHHYNQIAETRPALNQETTQFLNHIDYQTTSLDKIALRSQLPIESVTNKLLLLELDGWIINSAGGYSRV
jgi:DNA processing protein